MTEVVTGHANSSPAAGDATPLARRLKSFLALLAVQVGRFAPMGLSAEIGAEERRAAALEVALELASS